MTNYSFIRKLPGGGTYRLGTAVQSADGWRFISNVASHKNGRKFHATMEKCLPRWLGYPDACESVAVHPRQAVPAYHLSADERDTHVVWPWRRDDPYPGSKS